MKRRIFFLLLVLSLGVSLTAQVTQLAANNRLTFIASLGNNKALLLEASMKKLWVTDATTGGTIKLADTLAYEEAGGLLNGSFIFAATSPAYGSELWITDGTIAGTMLVKDIYPGKTGAEPHDDFALLNGYLYFSATAPDVGRELWRTNGTEAGTTLVKDIITGPASSALKGRFDISSAGSYLLFSTTTAATGYELWRSDGTADGTYLLKDINPGANSSQPAAYQVYNSITLFWAETADHGRELWRTDGTAGGTQLVKDIRPGTASSITGGFPLPNIRFLYPFNNRLLFIANDGIAGEEIWTTDGTSEGTFLLKDINTGAERSYVSLPESVSMNGRLYFSAYQEGTGAELWETNGTAAGTKLFKEILPGLDGGTPTLLPNVKLNNLWPWPLQQGPEFYFLFGLPANGGVELWKSNGTVAGTEKIKTIKTGNSDPGLTSFIYTASGLYLSVDDGVHGSELWKSDGTAAGTVLVANLNPNSGEGSEIDFFPLPVRNQVLFAANNGDQPYLWDLYRLDGNLVPLPVKLERFDVFLVNAGAQLNWQTASEENTLEFQVERSDDGHYFTAIGTLPAGGNVAAQRTYTFLDRNIAGSGKAAVYYRLLIKDRDGKVSRSKIVSLSLKGEAGFTMQLLGNPVQNEIRLTYTKNVSPVKLSISDASGRKLQVVQVINDSGMMTLPAANLVPGVYFLQAESKGKYSTVKFIKQ